MAGTEIRRKLTAPIITGKSASEIAEVGKAAKTPLYTIMGVARGYRTGESTYGPWMGLTGEFEAVNLETGEVYNSGRCFLPPHVLDMVVPALRGAEEDAAVEFALLIGVEPANNAFGYQYYASTYIDPRQSDRMETLRKMIPPATEILKLEDKQKEKKTG